MLLQKRREESGSVPSPTGRLPATRSPPAIERFETEAEISRRTGRVADEQWDYNRLVELYARTGRRDKALEYMGRVLDYVQSQPGRPNLATLTQLGVNFTTLGDREKAREYLDQALARSVLLGGLRTAGRMEVDC